MSPAHPSSANTELQRYASIFSALGDGTRLLLVAKLAEGQPCSISQLSENSTLSRQAITKHLRILEGVGLVHSTRCGRESIFELDLRPFENLKEYLNFVSDQWDQALSRLKSFVED